MTTRSWTGGNALLTDPKAWDPAGTPESGDTLYIGTGTATARWTVLKGLVINLEGPNFSFPPPTVPSPPVLTLRNSIVGADTTIGLGSILGSIKGLVYAANAITATIDARGGNLNLGTITTSGLYFPGPYAAASTLTLDVDGGVFANAGTLSVQTTGDDGGCTMVVQGASSRSELLNQGLITGQGTVKLDIDVIGTGTIAFGKVFEESHEGDVIGATIQAGKGISFGQTVDFAASGTDSHGALILGDAGDFRGLITNFTASADNYSNLHSDWIELPGIDVTDFAYHGTKERGVLTLRSGSDTVANLRFAGTYTTDSFEVLHNPTGTSTIELKPV